MIVKSKLFTPGPMMTPFPEVAEAPERVIRETAGVEPAVRCVRSSAARLPSQRRSADSCPAGRRSTKRWTSASTEIPSAPCRCPGRTSHPRTPPPLPERFEPMRLAPSERKLIDPGDRQALRLIEFQRARTRRGGCARPAGATGRRTARRRFPSPSSRCTRPGSKYRSTNRLFSFTFRPW